MPSSTQAFFHIICIGSVVFMVAGQEIVIDTEYQVDSQSQNSQSIILNQINPQSSQTGQSTEEEIMAGGEARAEEEEEEEEIDDNDPMARLNNVHSVDEFLSLLQKENGEPVTNEDIYSEYESEDGKQVIFTGGRMAVPDDCAPRNTTVHLQMNNTDSKEIFFPRCTMVERCGGCCPTPYLQCVSAYTERISLTVVKARASRPGSTNLIFSGLAPVVIDRHIRCTVRCSLTAEICGPKKRFLSNQCMCKCRRYTRCIAPRVFNSNSCECECPGGQQNCCPGGGQCGMVFNDRSCSCEVFTGRENMNNRNFTNSTSGDRNYIANNNIPGSDSSAVTTTTTTTTTTPTTPTPPVEDAATPGPCDNVQCPSTFRHVVVNGQCRCRPTGRFSRPRPRGRGRIGRYGK